MCCALLPVWLAVHWDERHLVRRSANSGTLLLKCGARLIQVCLNAPPCRLGSLPQRHTLAPWKGSSGEALLISYLSHRHLRFRSRSSLMEKYTTWDKKQQHFMVVDCPSITQWSAVRRVARLRPAQMTKYLQERALSSEGSPQGLVHCQAKASRSRGGVITPQGDKEPAYCLLDDTPQLVNNMDQIPRMCNDFEVHHVETPREYQPVDWSVDEPREERIAHAADEFKPGRGVQLPPSRGQRLLGTYDEAIHTCLFDGCTQSFESEEHLADLEDEFDATEGFGGDFFPPVDWHASVFNIVQGEVAVELQALYEYAWAALPSMQQWKQHHRTPILRGGHSQ
eukprot:5107613-Amphidinium_carterae.1